MSVVIIATIAISGEAQGVRTWIAIYVTSNVCLIDLKVTKLTLTHIAYDVDKAGWIPPMIKYVVEVGNY